MTVAELIEELKKVPQDMEVLLQKDEEGNGYQKLRCMGPGLSNEGDQWHIETVYDPEWTANEADMSEEEWEECKREWEKFWVLSP